MKQTIIQLLKCTLNLLILIADKPVLAEGFSDKDFEALSVFMGQTQETIELLGGDIYA